MKTLIRFSLLCITISNVVSIEDTPWPVIKTPQGDVQGTWKTTINGRKIQAFMGIPYAKPPVGPLRFKNPEPFGKWNSIQDGTKDPSACPQFGTFVGSTEVVGGSEDCLYLNVYTPETPKNSTYPVMVFIHGGAFYSGAAISSLYGPDMMLDKDIVLVVPNYRLGILGFGSTEDEVLPGNLGLKDQVLALKWVQENIASYGGNPDSVTLFGESAGAASVHYHMLSPLSKGLFHRAIPMSGSAYSPWAISAPGRVANFVRRFGEKLNCSTLSSEELMDCLSKVPVPSLIVTAANFTIWEGMDPSIIFTPVFENESEGSFITAESYKKCTSVPMMTGTTSEEGSFRVAAFDLSPIKLDGVLARLNEKFDKVGPVTMLFDDKVDNPTDVAMQIRQFFFGEKEINNDTIPELVNMYSDVFFFEAAKAAIKRHTGTAFVYLFAYEGPFSITQALTGGKFKYGVSHADDLQYLFPVKGLIIRNSTFNEEEKKVSQEFIDYIVNFATYGNPTPNGKPVAWGPTSKDDLNYLLINGIDSKMQNGFQSARNNFWENISWLSKVISKNE